MRSLVAGALCALLVTGTAAARGSHSGSHSYGSHSRSYSHSSYHTRSYSSRSYHTRSYGSRSRSYGGHSYGAHSSDYYTNVSGHRVHRPVFSASRPRGATAQCADGSYSFSEHARGTCSHHGGVR
jgi:hypothetical protein